MNWACVTHLIILFNILGISQAFFESCDQTINISVNAAIPIPSDGYPSVGYVPGSSGRYTIVAPVDYQIRASCNLIMYDPSNGNCTSERFYIAVDGKQDLSTSTYYCGTTTVALTSKGNKMILAYVSNAYSGQFYCTLTATCDCGWSVTSRIVNGTTAAPNEFTSMVGLVSLTSGKIFCGATIVSVTFVVTAAHCIRASPISNTVLVAGEHDVKTGADTNFTRLYQILQFIEYPYYSNITNLYDIGLIQTNQPIIWSRAVAPACLPFYYTSADFSGTNVTATGWGSTEYGGPLSTVLQKVNLNVLSNTDPQCTSTYPNIDSSQICTFTPNKDTCQSDSGGPLFYRGPSDPRLFLVALVSLGEGCASSSAALNTRLTSFLSWIESYTGSLCRRVLS